MIIWLMRKKWLIESKAWIAPAPADGHDRGPDLAPEHVAVGPGDEARPVDQGLHLGA